MDYMYDIRFLESKDNIKSLTKKLLGKTPSTELANQIAACLQQGRLFFESARKSSTIIRPIEIYYGILAFSVALVLFKNQEKLESLSQKHGLSPLIRSLKNTTSLDAYLSTVEILNDGTFQRVNDAVCKLEGLDYFGEDCMPNFISTPFSRSAELNGISVNFKDIMARITNLGGLYRSSFEESPKFESILLTCRNGMIILRLYNSVTIVQDSLSIEKFVNDIWLKHPFLKDWCLVKAEAVWGQTVLEFTNFSKSGMSEFENGFLIKKGNMKFEADYNRLNSLRKFNFLTKIPPVMGGLSKNFPNVFIVEPINSTYISEYSLYYLGSFFLSSLARYQPDKWMTLVSYNSDKLTALVEKFMDECLSYIPKVIMSVIHSNIK